MCQESGYSTNYALGLMSREGLHHTENPMPLKTLSVHSPIKGEMCSQENRRALAERDNVQQFL